MIHTFLRWMLAVMLLSAGFAMAQQEPTMNEIYATAEAGKLSQAQVMVQQVLVAHPNSAKAHYVESELFARQGNMGRAREALSTAERLAPGLPFVKPEAVQKLRDQISGIHAAPVARTYPQGIPANNPTGSNWLLPLLLTGGVIVLAYFIFRPRRPVSYSVADANGLSGPQGFGGNGGAVMQPTYGPSPYGGSPYAQPMYGQPAGSGLGGRIMGGVATGLAVGAGVVAAEAIGRSLMEGHEHNRPVDTSYTDYEPVNNNADMGGQNFGISDTSWDDGGSGGGGDWDN